MLLKGTVLYFISILFISTAFAGSSKITSIDVHRVSTGSYVDVTFDHPFSSKTIKPTYERNFIQFAAKGVAMDSARIVPVAGTSVDAQKFQKVFAYPYSADTTRIRLIFDSEKAPKNRLSFWNINPKVIRFLVKTTTATTATTIPVNAAVEQKTPEKETYEEKTALKEVVENTKDIDIHSPESVKSALNSMNAEKNEKASGIKKETIADEENMPLHSEAEEKNVNNRTSPSKYFFKMAAVLVAILGLFFGVVFLFKRYANKIKKLPFGKKERIIQVIATHYLGNKKSISLVKVADEYMVVGVGNEGISLISKLGPEVNVGQYLEDRFWGGTFEKHLKNYETDKKIMDEPAEPKTGEKNPGIQFSTEAIKKAAQYDGIRDLNPTVDANLHSAADEINDRVEISTLRNGIKEKLSKLKPLS